MPTSDQVNNLAQPNLQQQAKMSWRISDGAGEFRLCSRLLETRRLQAIFHSSPASHVMLDFFPVSSTGWNGQWTGFFLPLLDLARFTSAYAVRSTQSSPQSCKLRTVFFSVQPPLACRETYIYTSIHAVAYPHSPKELTNSHSISVR